MITNPAAEKTEENNQPPPQIFAAAKLKKLRICFCASFLRRIIRHVFDKDSIAACGVIDRDVGDGAHEFAILKNRSLMAEQSVKDKRFE